MCNFFDIIKIKLFSGIIKKFAVQWKCIPDNELVGENFFEGPLKIYT